jgi:hypothetical protein
MLGGALLCFLPHAGALGQSKEKSTSRNQQDTLKHFVPVPDRWRDISPPPYEMNVKGRWYDPYNQNVLKGDYPIAGQNSFFVLTASLDNFVETARLPTPSGVSTAQTRSPLFFGQGERLLVFETLKLSVELYHGQVAYRPRNWEFRVTPVFNLNYLDLRENNGVNINPRRGTNRTDSYLGLQELSFQKYLLTLSDNYDFMSVKVGIQRFNSDFRGLIFSEFNFGGRLFGSLRSNRYQYNLAYFRLLEKDTNSELNTVFDDRQQDVYVANLYRQDFLTLGYTAQLSFHFNKDRVSNYNDDNGFPIRPAVVGAQRSHKVHAYYLGWTGDGHWGWLNINHAFYQVFGTDYFSQFANRKITLNAQMAALELSVDRDWKRYRLSAFYASGDENPFDGAGQGFDTIVDNTFFAGGPFSYWNVQGIKLFGLNLVNKFSLLPSLRSAKFEGQPNFVNPGIFIANAAFDAEITPKLKLVLNGNYLSFVNTSSVQRFLNQPNIRTDIGIDYGMGLVWRPFLNNNAIFTLSLTGLTPLNGFRDIYDTRQTMFSAFTSLMFTY